MNSVVLVARRKVKDGDVRGLVSTALVDWMKVMTKQDDKVQKCSVRQNSNNLLLCIATNIILT